MVPLNYPISYGRALDERIFDCPRCSWLQPQLLTPSSSKRNLAKATCGADAMPPNRYTDNIPDPIEDQKPIDDFFASKLAERIRMDNWRKQLTLIRGEILEIAEQRSQQGLLDLKRETMKLARAN